MRRQISLNNLEIDKKEQVYLSFLCPEVIYLNVEEDLPLNKRVLKNEKISSNNYSSISGIVTKIKSVKKDNKKVVITNDFKEEEILEDKKKVDLNKVTAKEIISNLKKNNIKTTNNFLIANLLQKPKEILIIKCFDEEIGVVNASYILAKNIEKLLLLIDKLSTLFDFPKVILLFKAKDNRLITKCQENIGTYPNINTRLINDYYPLTDEFINSLVFLNETSNNSLILSVYDILEVYFSLKNSLFAKPKVITISGNMFDKTFVVETKIGVKISEILDSIPEIKNIECNYFLNSYFPINRIENIEDLIVTNDFKGLFFNKKVNEEICINCSKCYNICPVYINPKNINGKCIKCGLCSFCCPSNISLLEKKGSDEHV